MSRSFPFLLFALLILLFPFFMISFFNHPVGIHDWDWITEMEWNSLGFWQRQGYYYRNVMGRFFSTFLLSLTPFWYTPDTYKFFPQLFILGLAIGFYILAKAILIKERDLIVLTLVLIIIYLHGLSGIFEVLYTISGSLTYWSGMILFLFGLGIAVQLLKYFHPVRFGTLMLIIVCLNGCNEIHLVSTNLVIGLWLSYLWLMRQKVPAWGYVLLILSIVSAIIAIAAPGNYTRMAVYPGAGNWLSAFLMAFLAMGQNLLGWMVNTPILLLSLIVLTNPSLLNSRLLSFRSYFDLFYFLMAGILLQFLPLWLLFYASGPNSLPERVVDVLYCNFLLTWFGLLVGWINSPFFLHHPLIMPRLYQYIIGVTIFCFLLFSPLRLNRKLPAPRSLAFSELLPFVSIDNNIAKAWISILNSEAILYNKESLEAYKQLKNCVSDTCYIDPPSTYPAVIYDRLFDRKDKEGEPFMGYYWNNKAQLVLYSN